VSNNYVNKAQWNIYKKTVETNIMNQPMYTESQITNQVLLTIVLFILILFFSPCLCIFF